MESYEQIILAFIVGVSVAAAYTFYTKSVLGSLVRKLFENNAFDEDSAITLEEAGCDKKFLLKYSLRPGTDFAETVRSVNGKYYIPEENIEKAESKYKGEGITVLIVLAAILVLALIALAGIYIFPDFMDMVRGI